jgi:glycosyltransferase A (GT-A) superfamily protein (DUF2064 family)
LETLVTSLRIVARLPKPDKRAASIAAAILRVIANELLRPAAKAVSTKESLR